MYVCAVNARRYVRHVGIRVRSVGHVDWREIATCDCAHHCYSCSYEHVTRCKKKASTGSKCQQMIATHDNPWQRTDSNNWQRMGANWCKRKPVRVLAKLSLWMGSTRHLQRRSSLFYVYNFAHSSDGLEWLGLSVLYGRSSWYRREKILMPKETHGSK